MPYIHDHERRKELAQGALPRNAAEFAYQLYYQAMSGLKDDLSFDNIVAVMRVLEDAYRDPMLANYGGSDYQVVRPVVTLVRMELYRRVIAPYEDLKRKENGDVVL